MVESYIGRLKSLLAELPVAEVEAVAGAILDAWRQKRRIFIMGNGGSASTASHFARDLQIGTAVGGKPRLKTICLADNIACITSVANDLSYESVFEEQLIDQVCPGDVVIGISASGNSSNVLRAIDYARKSGALTIGLVGFGGGRLKDLADKSIVLSATDYGIVEDIHLSLAHMIAYLVKERITLG